MVNSIRREGEEKEELEVSVGGLNFETEQNGSWFMNSNLKEGDKVSFEIITSAFNKPNRREQRYKEKIYLLTN